MSKKLGESTRHHSQQNSAKQILGRVFVCCALFSQPRNQMSSTETGNVGIQEAYQIQSWHPSYNKAGHACGLKCSFWTRKQKRKEKKERNEVLVFSEKSGCSSSTRNPFKRRRTRETCCIRTYGVFISFGLFIIYRREKNQEESHRHVSR